MMTTQGWAEIALTLSLSVALAWPIGMYLSRVWNGERTWLDPLLKPVEGLFYKAAGVDPKRSQGWGRSRAFSTRRPGSIPNAARAGWDTPRP